MGVNKVVYGTTTIIDISDSTVAANKMLKGTVAYGANGDKVTGNIETKTSSNLSASGKTVTVPAGYYASNATKDVSTVTRATTSISTTADTTNAKLTLSASNNQGTGYVTGSNQTASKVITLTASGATVTATDNSATPVKVSKSVATASRASTSITTAADDTNDVLTITASNNQGTGYVTGSNQTAEKKVTLSVNTPTIDSSGNVTAVATASDNSTTAVKVSKTSSALALGVGSLSVSGKTVTASKGYYSAGTSKSVADGAYSASVSLTSGNGSVSATSTNVTLTEASSKPSSGYYITATGSGSVSATGTATVGTAGYIASGSKSSSASSKSSNTATKYYTLPSGGCTVAGGGLTKGNGSVSASGTNVTLTESTSKPSSGSYITVTGSGSVSRAAVTDTHTAGYIPAKSATTVISSASETSNTATKYYTLPTKTSSDVTVSGTTVTVPAGYYHSQVQKTVSGGGGTTLETCTVTVHDNDYCGVGSVTSITLVNGQLSQTVHDVPYGGSVTFTQAVGLPFCINAGYCYGGISCDDRTAGDDANEGVHYNSNYNTYYVVLSQQYVGHNIVIDVYG